MAVGLCAMIAILTSIRADAEASGLRTTQPAYAAATPESDPPWRKTVEPSAGNDGEWSLHGGDYRNRQFSPLQQITTTNINRLKLAWYVDLDTNRGIEATPIVVGGVMYVTASWSHLVAIEAATGKVLWRFDPQVPGKYGPRGCCDVVSRGVAVEDGKVFLATFDGRLFALDAQTGAALWQVDTITDRNMSYTITGAPLVADRLIVIGNGGAELGVRGYVTAYDIQTGAQRWRFFTVPGDPSQPFESAAMKMAAATWTGEWWKYGGGGTVWDSMLYDPKLDLIYIGVGNGGPWNQTIRSPGGGDNLFLSSIVAVKRATGEYVWHYQETPGDAWDYTATQPLMLLDLVIDGRLRKAIVQAPKNGFFYVLDRESGELISAKNYVPVNWTSGIDPKSGRPVFAEGVHYRDREFSILPGPTGAHNWQPMAFSPQTGLVYIPALELGPTTFTQDPQFVFTPGRINVGVDFSKFYAPENPTDFRDAQRQLKGSLIAWDPVAQREAWRVRHRAPWDGGVLATAGGLLFQGTPDGRLLALSARRGTQLWQFSCQTGVMAAPISFQQAGRQFISVAVGWGSHYGLEWGEFSRVATGNRPNISRVLTFELNGRATLPPARTLPSQGKPAVPVSAADTAQMVADGRLLYTRHCAACHGGAAISGGVLPDLRMSSAGIYNHWDAIVLEGALESQGMPNLSNAVTRADLAAIRSYVLHRAYETWSRKRYPPPNSAEGVDRVTKH